MIFSRHPRRSVLYSANPLLPYFKSHRNISFADRHPLTLLESYRFKNVGGGGIVKPPTFQPAKVFLSISFPFTLLLTLLHDFALFKITTLFLSTVSALFAKNHPGWGYPPRFPRGSK